MSTWFKSQSSYKIGKRSYSNVRKSYTPISICSKMIFQIQTQSHRLSKGFRTTRVSIRTTIKMWMRLRKPKCLSKTRFSLSLVSWSVNSTNLSRSSSTIGSRASTSNSWRTTRIFTSSFMRTQQSRQKRTSLVLPRDQCLKRLNPIYCHCPMTRRSMNLIRTQALSCTNWMHTRAKQWESTSMIARYDCLSRKTAISSHLWDHWTPKDRAKCPASTNWCSSFWSKFKLEDCHLMRNQKSRLRPGRDPDRSKGSSILTISSPLSRSTRLSRLNLW
jgi:hypothetical protein